MAIQQVMLAQNIPAAPPGSGHLYWRILVTTTEGASSYCSLAEIAMRITPGGANQCTGGTGSALSSYPGYPATNAFDNSASSVWASNGGLPMWIRYQFASPKDIVEMAITSTDAAYGGTVENLQDFTFEYSDNGTTWTVGRTVTGQSWTYSQTKTFSIP